MPRPKVWFIVRLDTIYGYIALLQVQQRQEHADGVRFLLRWSGYKVDETAIERHIAKLTSHTQDD